MPDLYKYQVGQLYNPARTSWPETAQYNWRSGAHSLDLFWPGLTEPEITRVRTGQLDLAVMTHRRVIFLLYRFAGLPWSDQPFSIHMVTAGLGPQELPPLVGEPGDELKRYLLNITLVESETGIVRALRTVSMSPHFTRKLHQLINRQSAEPFDQASYDADIQSAYARYPDSDKMRRAALAYCTAGTAE